MHRRHMICSTKARQDIQVFVTNHDNLLRLLVPGYLCARFMCGNELWWQVKQVRVRTELAGLSLTPNSGFRRSIFARETFLVIFW